MKRALHLGGTLAMALAFATAKVNAQATPPSPAVNARSVVDLRTSTGVALVDGQWRYADATVAQVPFRLPGADRKPSGSSDVTLVLQPAAMAPGFNDSNWQIIPPEGLEDRRGAGKVSF